MASALLKEEVLLLCVLVFQAGRRTAHLNHAPPCEPTGAIAGSQSLPAFFFSTSNVSLDGVINIGGLDRATNRGWSLGYENGVVF